MTTATKTSKNYTAWNVQNGDVVQNANGKKTAVVIGQGPGVAGKKGWYITVEVTEANGATYTECMTTALLEHRFPIMPSRVRSVKAKQTQDDFYPMMHNLIAELKKIHKPTEGTYYATTEIRELPYELIVALIEKLQG